MYLKTGTKYGCVYATLAMLLDKEPKQIEKEFNPNGMKFFNSVWPKLPIVPSKPEIVDWLWHQGYAVVDFVRDPKMKPHVEAPAVSVHENSEEVFKQQLSYGVGFLEGFTKLGHMCAWDGERIYDPRGYVYSYENAYKYCFEPESFSMVVKCR
jgi:hypothetical protein